MRLRKPSPALLVALLALFVALGGPAQAAKLINGRTIKKGTITTTQIKDRSIGARDVSRAATTSLRYTPNNTITAAKIVRDGVSSSEIKANAVGASELGSSAVSSVKVADNSLVAQDLATGSVTSDELADGTVKNADLAASSVTKSKLGGGSVGASEVADGTLTGRDIASFFGTVGIDIPVIAANACATVNTAAQPPVTGSQNIQDDLIVLGRSADVPPTLSLAAQPITGNATAFSVVACNLSPAATAAARYTLPFMSVTP